MTYSPVARLLTTLDLLQSRPAVTAAQLAERLEVETRSVRRYITMLQDIGIPVEAERGRYGGYRLRPGFKLPPLMWTEEEALAVTLGLQVVQQLGLSQPVTTVESALAKVERVLPLALRERVQAVQETVVLDLATEAVPATFATLEETPAGILLRAYDDDLQHTARFLVNLGCPFRVLQPPELVGELRRLAESILDMTKSGENQPSDAL